MSSFQFEDLEKATNGRMYDVVITEARREYEEYYRDEITLNKDFHKFVHNYQLAYQGPNTARAQIGTTLKRSCQTGSYVHVCHTEMASSVIIFLSIEYSQFLDDKMMQPGREYLPLGPAFQAHVACFMTYVRSYEKQMALYNA